MVGKALLTEDSRWRAFGDFPGSLVVKTPSSNAGGAGSIPGWGTKVPCAMECGQKLKETKELEGVGGSEGWEGEEGILTWTQ